jgi:hypothetical protein
MDGEDVYLNMVKHIIMFIRYRNKPELWVLEVRTLFDPYD